MWVLTSGYLLHIPVWQEGILGVPVDGVGHISVGLEGEQVHHAGRGANRIHEHTGLEINAEQCGLFNATHPGSSSVAVCFTKDRKSQQKFIQTVGFQQFCSLCSEQMEKNIWITVFFNLCPTPVFMRNKNRPEQSITLLKLQYGYVQNPKSCSWSDKLAYKSYSLDLGECDCLSKTATKDT